MSTVAGVLVVTCPGAAPRGRRASPAWPASPSPPATGRPGWRRVWEATDGGRRAEAERILAEDPEALGMYPTFVGDDEA